MGVIIKIWDMSHWMDLCILFVSMGGGVRGNYRIVKYETVHVMVGLGNL